MFNILDQFDSFYNKEKIWNCRYCINLTYGCNECVIKENNKSCILSCRSFQYFVFNKIRCECLGKGCKYCKQKGFIVERIHNYKTHETSYENDSEYINFENNYTVIKEEDWNHFKCLSVFFIPPSEKERLKNKILQKERLPKIMELAVSKISPLVISKFLKI